jgi:hypothetical protein
MIDCEDDSMSNDHFTISKDFSLKENEEIEFVTYFDISKRQTFILAIKDNKVHICIKPNHNGSIFYGNYVIEEPSFLLIKKIDPLILLIGLMHITTKIQKDKYSSLDLLTIGYKYNELIDGGAEDFNLQEEDVKSTKYFVQFLLNETNGLNIDKICEITFSNNINKYI